MQDTQRNRMVSGLLLLLLLSLLAGGCASMVKPQAQLEKDVREFSRHLRWGDWEAAATFLAGGEREGFLSAWKADRDLNLVEVRVEKLEPLSEDQSRSHLELEYFRLPSTVVRRHSLVSLWQYDPGESRMGGRWEVLAAPAPPP